MSLAEPLPRASGAAPGQPEWSTPGACCPTGAAVGFARTGGLARFVSDAGEGLKRLDLLVPGVHCAACIQRIEEALPKTPGLRSARVNLSLRRVSATYDPARAEPEDVVEALSRLGYPARPFDARAMHDAERDGEGRDLLARLAVAGFAAMNVMLLSVAVWSGATDATRDLLHWVSALIALPATAFAGVPFFRSALGVLRHGHVNMDVPISLALILAVGVSLFEVTESGTHAYFDAAVSLCFFLLLGRVLDHGARRHARLAAAELGGLQAHSATVVGEGGLRRVVAVEDLRPGDRIEVAAGERAPADGRVIEGASDLDRSMITGESRPEPAAIGAEIHAGVLNLSAPLLVEATATGDDTALAGIARMIQAAEGARTRYVDWALRAAKLYVPIVHLAAAVTFAGWLLAGLDLRDAVLIAAAVLIITCPCALGLAAPAVHAAAGGRLFRAGIFLKDGAALERLADVDVAVFDKTGTLTTGEPTLVEAPEAPALWSAARALAQVSRHPFSKALAAAAEARGLPAAPATALKEVPGCGVEGEIDGRPARLGRADWCGAEAAADAGSAVWLRLGDEAPVRFGFEDPLRPDAAATVAALQARGLEVRLISGDAEAAVARAAAEAGIARWRAGATPADKVAALEALAAEGRTVLMVGDGINDAPALAAAAASISPASAADVSRAAAGMALAGSRLNPVVVALDVARAAKARVFENFAFAALYNACAVPLAAFGFVTPLIAALAMSGSSIVVTLNALRMRRAGRAAEAAGEALGAPPATGGPA
ncbi:heavy metal translocating P-type ATPase [Albimonas pacifica]|uniref:Cu2+-exporting ATPase n=1 Tax=Albimonas pacifica TaxID=1114924 RepID=A0A1I3LRA8_9RHOB|nr:heavy metal translocating P-type ATPase [Albimonas pacifica]SFI87299.1 Cu2+-exporting ATPase [Albimonas pacifica]